MKLGVVGPFFRGRAHAAGWVESVAAQDHQDLGLYVVDDASGDGTADALADALDACGRHHRLLRRTDNGGPAAARNAAIRAALDDGCEALLLLDSDSRAAPDWAGRHAALLAHHRQAVGVCGAIVGRADTWWGRADGYAAWYTSTDGGRPGPLRGHHVSTNNLSLRAELFTLHRLWLDERLRTGEDLAFCQGVAGRDLQLWRQPDLVVHHLDRSTADAARQHHYAWGRHARALAEAGHGGYFAALTGLPRTRALRLLQPAIASATTTAALLAWTRRHPDVWLHAPGIAWLKWQNARGIVDGLLARG